MATMCIERRGARWVIFRADGIGASDGPLSVWDSRVAAMRHIAATRNGLNAPWWQQMCDSCNAAATRIAYYGDDETIAGMGQGIMYLCASCRPSNRLPGDPRASYDRIENLNEERGN